jgi:hypothetical protein
MTYDATRVGYHDSKNGCTFYIPGSYRSAPANNRVIGWRLGASEGETCVFSWCEDGKYLPTTMESSGYDLVKYLGTELPKPKRIVKMAPFLLKGLDGRPYLGQTFYRDGDDYPGGSDVVIRHLIGTAYEIEVEVEG